MRKPFCPLGHYGGGSTTLEERLVAWLSQCEVTGGEARARESVPRQSSTCKPLTQSRSGWGRTGFLFGGMRCRSWLVTHGQEPEGVDGGPDFRPPRPRSGLSARRNTAWLSGSQPVAVQGNKASPACAARRAKSCQWRPFVTGDSWPLCFGRTEACCLGRAPACAEVRRVVAAAVASRRARVAGRLPRRQESSPRYSALPIVPGPRRSRPPGRQTAVSLAVRDSLLSGRTAAFTGLHRRSRRHTGPVIPDPSYVKTPDGVHIAYKVIGNGPLDLIWPEPCTSVLEHIERFPPLTRFVERIASVELNAFPREVWGCPTAFRSGDAPEVSRVRMGDMIAVMDEVGSHRAAIFGWDDTGPRYSNYDSTPHRAGGFGAV